MSDTRAARWTRHDVAALAPSSTLAIMSLPPLCISTTAAPAALALGALCLVVVPPQFAAGAAPLGATSTDDDTCASALTRIAEAGEALGYSTKTDASGFTGARAAIDFRVTCSQGQVDLELTEDGARVNVNFYRTGSVFALDLTGEFSGLGSVHHTSTLEEISGQLVGSLTFAADTADTAAFVGGLLDRQLP